MGETQKGVSTTAEQLYNLGSSALHQVTGAGLQ